MVLLIDRAAGWSLEKCFGRGDEDALAEAATHFCPTIGLRLACRYVRISRDRGEHLALGALPH